MTNIYRRLRILIEESSDAYKVYLGHDTPNVDWAGFASLQLGDFQRELSNPELTPQQLRSIMRKGMQLHKSAPPGSCWSTFMAQYVRHAAGPGAMQDNNIAYDGSI